MSNFDSKPGKLHRWHDHSSTKSLGFGQIRLRIVQLGINPDAGGVLRVLLLVDGPVDFKLPVLGAGFYSAVHGIGRVHRLTEETAVEPGDFSLVLGVNLEVRHRSGHGASFCSISL